MDKTSDIYKYSGSLQGPYGIMKLNSDYFGCGVGGALAQQGLGELVPEFDIWAGKLKPGDQIQMRHTDDASTIKLKLSNGELVWGHSVIFMRYSMGDNGALEVIYSDYAGKEKVLKQGDKPSIFGVNIIDT